jgi:hypothetical protein
VIESPTFTQGPAGERGWPLSLSWKAARAALEPETVAIAAVKGE